MHAYAMFGDAELRLALRNERPHARYTNSNASFFKKWPINSVISSWTSLFKLVALCVCGKTKYFFFSSTGTFFNYPPELIEIEKFNAKMYAADHLNLD